MSPEFMKFLSYPLNEQTPLYGNGRGISLHSDKVMTSGDSCNTMNWSFPNHSGTHIDAPKHFDPEGKAISDYPASFWIFNKVCVLDISAKVCESCLIESNWFESIPAEDTELLIIKTGWGKHRGTDLYTLTPPGIHHEVADWCRKHLSQLRVLGMDLISISSFANREEGRKAHKAFLAPEEGEPILLLEDMDLSNTETISQVIVSPLIVEGADGAPCTLIEYNL